MRYATLTAMLLAMACSDGTGPVVDLELAVDARVLRVGWDDAMGRQECEFEMAATAVGGKRAQQATWVAGSFALYLSNGLVIGQELDALGMLDMWGVRGVRSGETVTVERLAISPLPFEMAMTFRYLLPGDRAGSKTILLDCKEAS